MKHILLTLIILSSIFLSGCFLFEESAEDLTEEELIEKAASLPSSMLLLSCVTPLDDHVMPSEVGKFISDPLATNTGVFTWNDANEVNYEFASSEGRVAVYTYGPKMVEAAVVKLDHGPDYNLLQSSVEGVVAEDTTGSTSTIALADSIAYSVDELEAEGTISWYIAAGENIWVQFVFEEQNYEESIAWIVQWTELVCN